MAKQTTRTGIDEKVRRASGHLKAFEREWRPITEDPHANGFVFEPDIYENGHRHVYRAKNPPPLDPKFAAIAGDCAHNLRVALDHLAWQLVRAGGFDPDITTQFPARGRRTLAALSLEGYVPEQALTLIKAVQPDHGGNDGFALRILNELDVIDKHRHLAVVAVGTRQATSSGVEGEHAFDILYSKLTGLPLAHNQIVGWFQYAVPHLDADPQLRFTPQISFDQPLRRQMEGLIAAILGPTTRGWAEGDVASVLAALLYWLEDVLLPRFDPWLGPRSTL